MNFVLELITKPDDEPVTIEELKRHLRTFASNTDEDDDLLALISSAREWAEDYSGYALMEQQWRLTFETVPLLVDPMIYRAPSPWYQFGKFDMPPNGEIMLRRTPVSSIDSFVSVDSLGAETNVSASAYVLAKQDSKWPSILPTTTSGFFIGSYKVEFTAGYSDDENIPIRFKQAIKLHAEAHYDRDKDEMKALLDAAEGLLRPIRANLQLA